MELFNYYEEDFLELRDAIQKRLEVIPTYDGEQKNYEITLAQKDIKDAEAKVKQMNLSARESNKADLLSKVKNYENEVARLKTGLRKAELAMTALSDRKQLFDGYTDPSANISTNSSMEQRERLLKTTERERRTNDDIDEAISLSTNTIGQGMEIMEELDRQKDIMTSVIEKTREVQYKLKRAGRVLTTMYRRSIINKIILFVIILALLAGIIIVVYFKWFYHESPSTSNTQTTGSTSTSGTSTTSGLIQ